MVSYSTDAYRWQYLVDRYGNQKVRDAEKNVKHLLTLICRYFLVIPILILFDIIISTKQSLHASSNFIRFNGIHILPYASKSSVVKVYTDFSCCISESVSHLECKQQLGLPPYGKISASTSWPYRRRASCQPEDGYIMSNKGWCSRKRYS